MEKERPDNIVFSEEQGYNASLLPYATNVGAPLIKILGRAEALVM